MLVRRDEIRCIRDAELPQQLVALEYVLFKFLLCNQKGVSVAPRGVEQVAIGVTSYIVSFGDKSANHIRVHLEELSSEEESAFDVVLSQCRDDSLRSVGLVRRREHKVYVLD